jgi:glyoxylate carboligase
LLLLLLLLLLYRDRQSMQLLCLLSAVCHISLSHASPPHTHTYLPLLRTLQAFYLARTGRPGPVLVDVPKDIQQQLALPDWDAPMAIAGYMSRLPPPPQPAALAAVAAAIRGAKKPVRLR